MLTSSISIPNNRFGVHYFPDTHHYRDVDLDAWLPELRMLGVSWITLLAHPQRLIPESFLNGLQSVGIQPVIHIPIAVNEPVLCSDLQVLFESYARWGVHHIALFDRPNSRAAWSYEAWAQTELVERFLDIYLPMAELILQEGLAPVFPPLEPGGDYWDLAFLRGVLKSLRRRGKTRLLESLVLGVYAWAGNRPLDWGEGGLDRWPGARPYNTPPGVQDHLGFRIFDWYLDITRQELGKTLPVILLRAGSCLNNQTDPSLPAVDIRAHKERNLALMKQINYDEVDGGSRVPPEIIACNFWLLAAEAQSPYATEAWFHPNGEHLPITDAIRRKAAEIYLEKPSLYHAAPLNSTSVESMPEASIPSHTIDHSINHYVLLPLYGWGVAEWDLNLIQPILEQSHPTLGFSLVEARLAERVTVVGGESVFSEEALKMLREAGCTVERLLEDGTLVAS
jgi:hypothetical protein